MLYLGRILDYVIEPVPIDLPLTHPTTTQLTHVACGRAHTVVVTNNEGSELADINSYIALVVALVTNS